MTTVADVRAAARRIDGRIIRTPLRHSPWLSAAAGGDVFLKLESLQPTFSFKIRGAFNTVLKLVEDGGEARPLVTASAGNHGRALAYAARAAGLRLTVYAPATAPRAKLDAIREAGAELKTCGDYDEAEVRAKEHGAEGDALFVSAYSHPDVIAGAGTIGLEILEDLPDVEAIVVPVGGGGLISGVAIAARGISDTVSILGVEAEASQAFTKSLAAGRIVPIEVGPTLADGLAGNLDPDAVTFDIVRRLVLGIVLVDERGLQDGVAGTAREERLVAEPAGAAAAAGVLSGRIELDGRLTAVILSGGNIDVEKLKALI